MLEIGDVVVIDNQSHQWSTVSAGDVGVVVHAIPNSLRLKVPTYTLRPNWMVRPNCVEKLI